MRALHTTLALETGAGWAPAMTVATRHPAAVRAEAAARWATVRNMALFLMAPFVGLVYAVLLPFVGLAMLAWMGAKACHETGVPARMLRTGGKILRLAAAPFVALAFVVAMPFIGLGMLGWVGVRAALGAA